MPENTGLHTDEVGFSLQRLMHDSAYRNEVTVNARLGAVVREHGPVIITSLRVGDGVPDELADAALDALAPFKLLGAEG